jgi:hypothetical protein
MGRRSVLSAAGLNAISLRPAHAYAAMPLNLSFTGTTVQKDSFFVKSALQDFHRTKAASHLLSCAVLIVEIL